MPREPKPKIEFDFDEEAEQLTELFAKQEMLKRHAQIATENGWAEKAVKLNEIARGIRAFEVTIEKRPDRHYLKPR